MLPGFPEIAGGFHSAMAFPKESLYSQTVEKPTPAELHELGGKGIKLEVAGLTD